MLLLNRLGYNRPWFFLLFKFNILTFLSVLYQSFYLRHEEVKTMIFTDEDWPLEIWKMLNPPSPWQITVYAAGLIRLDSKSSEWGLILFVLSRSVPTLVVPDESRGAPTPSNVYRWIHLYLCSLPQRELSPGVPLLQQDLGAENLCSTWTSLIWCALAGQEGPTKVSPRSLRSQ